MFRFLSQWQGRFSFFALACVLASSCFSSGTGESPKETDFYFPVGLALSPQHLFIANSNFDLRYSAGSVQALGLDAIAKDARACAENPTAAGCYGNDMQALRGSNCSDSRVACASRYARASVQIGAFAADIISVPRYDSKGQLVSSGKRLLIPVRGDASVTSIDFDEDAQSITFRCNANPQPNRFNQTCSADWHVGNDATKNSRQLVLEGEPFSIASPSIWPSSNTREPRSSGGIAAVAHQQSGNVSLLVNLNRDQEAPKLAFSLTGLPAGATGIAALDSTTSTDGTTNVLRFLVTNRTQGTVYTVNFYGNAEQPDRAKLAIGEVVPLSTNASGTDSRGVVVDPPGQNEKRPTRVFLTSRSPTSLVIGDFIPTRTPQLQLQENIPLPLGPSRIARSSIVGSNGIAHTQLYMTHFDSQWLVSFDPDARRFNTIARTGRGPYALVVDEARKLLFITNFIDSTVQVIELDPTRPRYEQTLFTLGAPSAVTR